VLAEMGETQMQSASLISMQMQRPCSPREVRAAPRIPSTSPKPMKAIRSIGSTGIPACANRPVSGRLHAVALPGRVSLVRSEKRQQRLRGFMLR
jgi:hypothetical protein